MKYRVTLEFRSSMVVAAENEDAAKEEAARLTDNVAFLELMDWESSEVPDDTPACNE